MSTKIIIPRQKVTEVHWKLDFDITSDGGYTFDCDSNGRVCVEDMSPEAIENYEWCLANPEKFIRPAHIRKETWSYMGNATAECSSCGERFELFDEYLGACECPKCGQWYNLFGQELLPPEEWEDDPEEETW